MSGREQLQGQVAAARRLPASGFTLIELVIVITIIGILAAVALPRYVAIQRDARIAKLNAARGAVGAAAATVHAAILTRGRTADTAACPGAVPAVTADNVTTVCTENGVVRLVNGYPEAFGTANLGGANSAGIIAAAGLTSIFNPTAAELTVEGYIVTGTDTLQTIQVAGATDPATCFFTYAEPTAAGAGPVISAVNSAGC